MIKKGGYVPTGRELEAAGDISQADIADAQANADSVPAGRPMFHAVLMPEDELADGPIPDED